ncbi:MAG TPA: outer membrane beta-barrel protein [Myxococcaceae bacterium]|nr:outer membrane beta-barrel protein [Myxococcaceae bacterium]
MVSAGLVLLGLLSSVEGGADSVFDEPRLGVELGGRAAGGQSYWVQAAGGPSFGVDLRLRFSANLSLGLELDIGSFKSPEGDQQWKLQRKQIGFDVQWRFDTGPRIRPWVSLGMSFGSADLEYEDGSFRSSAHTWDFARLGLGVDFLVGRVFALGPLVRGALGRTNLIDVTDPPGADTSRSLDSLEVGLRVLVGF